MQSLETTAITTADHPPKVWECHVDVRDIFQILIIELLSYVIV